MHPFRETAELLRACARLERERGGKWYNRELVERLQKEARELESLAKIDQHTALTKEP